MKQDQMHEHAMKLVFRAMMRSTVRPAALLDDLEYGRAINSEITRELYDDYHGVYDVLMNNHDAIAYDGLLYDLEHFVGFARECQSLIEIDRKYERLDVGVRFLQTCGLCPFSNIRNRPDASKMFNYIDDIIFGNPGRLLSIPEYREMARIGRTETAGLDDMVRDTVSYFEYRCSFDVFKKAVRFLRIFDVARIVWDASLATMTGTHFPIPLGRAFLDDQYATRAVPAVEQIFNMDVKDRFLNEPHIRGRIWTILQVVAAEPQLGADDSLFHHACKIVSEKVTDRAADIVRGLNISRRSSCFVLPFIRKTVQNQVRSIAGEGVLQQQYPQYPQHQIDYHGLIIDNIIDQLVETNFVSDW